MAVCGINYYCPDYPYGRETSPSSEPNVYHFLNPLLQQSLWALCLSMELKGRSLILTSNVPINNFPVLASPAGDRTLEQKAPGTREKDDPSIPKRKAQASGIGARGREQALQVGWTRDLS